MYNSMLSVVEGGGPMRGGFGRVRVCIRKRVYLASVIWAISSKLLSCENNR